MALTVATVNIDLRSLSSTTLATGTVYFSAPYDLYDTSGHIVWGKGTKAATITAGVGSISLPVNDGAGITPSGWAWSVTIDTDTVRSRYDWLLTSAMGSPVNFADTGPAVTPPTLVTYALDAAVVHKQAAVDPTWAPWSDTDYSTGFNTSTDPIFNQISGVLETTGMFVARGAQGRFHATFADGSHLFEGWNAAATGRLTALIGLNGGTEAALFVYSPGGGGSFGTVRVGSDSSSAGYLFGSTTADFLGTVRHRLDARFDTGMHHGVNNDQIEVAGGSIIGAGTRDGASLVLRGGQHGSAPGSAQIYMGSYVQSITATNTQVSFSFIAGPAQSPVDRLVIRGDGRVTASGSLVLSTSSTPASASAAGVTGQIAWDTGFLYICTTTNTWKRVAIATW